MKNTKENAQLILSKYCGLNDETLTGESVLNAMIEYAAKVKKLNIPAVINSVCPFCNSKETEDNQPTRHCRYCNQDYGQTDL